MDKGKRPPAGAVDRSAISVSIFAFPTIFYILVFMIIAHSLLPFPGWLMVSLLCILFASILPMVIIWARRTEQDSLDTSKRRTGWHSWPVPVIVSYLAGALGIWPF